MLLQTGKTVDAGVQLVITLPQVTHEDVNMVLVKRDFKRLPTMSMGIYFVQSNLIRERNIDLFYQLDNDNCGNLGILSCLAGIAYRKHFAMTSWNIILILNIPITVLTCEISTARQVITKIHMLTISVHTVTQTRSYHQNTLTCMMPI